MGNFYFYIILLISALYFCSANGEDDQTTLASDQDDEDDHADSGLQDPNIFKKEDKAYWEKLGLQSIDKALKMKMNEGVAKNVIIFVGDGMGMATVTASRIFKGQKNGRPGEEGYLAFEEFPNVGLIKTYTVDKQVPDSAGTASALFSGIKAKSKTVGYDATITPLKFDKDSYKKAEVKTIMDWGIEANKSTGLVTTTRITHATPSAAYAHSAFRDWECETNIPREYRDDCPDIARQLVEQEPGRSINVILGGGESYFLHNVTNPKCIRQDGRDLTADWEVYQTGNKKSHKFVKTTKELREVDESTERLLGLFSSDHMPYDLDRNTGDDGQPSLTEMTTKALRILQKNENGFVLIVEGGKIDVAHHDNLAKVALEEVMSFEKAIIASYNMTNPNDTLIVVTADHSHSFTMNGYPDRGNPIEGLSGATREGFRYQTLSYMNGPGYYQYRLNFTKTTTKTSDTWTDLNKTATEKIMDRKTRHFAAYWDKHETHGGEDVAVYASGPMGHLLHGVHEQTHIAYTMAYSACIGPYQHRENCPNTQDHQKSQPRLERVHAKHSSGSTMLTFSNIQFLIVFFALFQVKF